MDNRNIIKVAVIDMNNGSPNQGIRGITQLLSAYQQDQGLELKTDLFDLRAHNDIPGTDYDIYISSGGPGSPFEGKDQQWENSFFLLLDQIETYNTSHEDKKSVFLICFSFQLACRKFNLGTVTPRNSTSFGIFPITLTAQGETDPIYEGLPNPFFAVDSRDWQVIDAEDENFNLRGAEILAIEKERRNVDLERCMMSIRFTKEIVGTQFHPEADPAGMNPYNLTAPERILQTRAHILPNFLNEARQFLKNTSHDQ